MLIKLYPNVVCKWILSIKMVTFKTYIHHTCSDQESPNILKNGSKFISKSITIMKSEYTKNENIKENDDIRV